MRGPFQRAPPSEVQEWLGGSSFHLAVPAAAEADGDAAGSARCTVWGRGAWSRFAGAAITTARVR